MQLNQPPKIHIIRLKNMLECPYGYILHEHLKTVQRPPYWQNRTVIIALIKRCWQELALPLDLPYVQSLISARFSEFTQYLDTASPRFWFDQTYILQVVHAWFEYEWQTQAARRSIWHDTESIPLNNALTLAVDRIEYGRDGTKRYVFYTFDTHQLSFMRHIRELQTYHLVLAHLRTPRCRMVALQPRQARVSLENMSAQLLNPRKCMACYRKQITLKK